MDDEYPPEANIRRCLLEDTERAEGISKAAWQLEDAMNGRVVKFYPSDGKARDAYFDWARANRYYGMSIWGLYLLSMIEVPAWCDNINNFYTFLDPSTRCQVEGVKSEDLLLSNVPYLPPFWSLVLEGILVHYIFMKLLVERHLQVEYFEHLHVDYFPSLISVPKGVLSLLSCGRRGGDGETEKDTEGEGATDPTGAPDQYYHVNNNWLIKAGLAFCVFEIMDMVIFILFRNPFRLAFISRTAFMVFLPQVLTLFSSVATVIQEFVTIAVFFVSGILLFAWIATMLFDGVQGEVYGEQVTNGFDSFTNSMNTMFIAGATDDFFECFRNSYSKFRISGLLWLAFLVIVHVLLLSLVLDTLVSAYTKLTEGNEEEGNKEKLFAIRKAYDTLVKTTGEPNVSMDDFKEFAAEYSRSPRVNPGISQDNAQIIFTKITTEAVFLPKEVDGVKVLVNDTHNSAMARMAKGEYCKWRATNDELKSSARGLAYQKEKEVNVEIDGCVLGWGQSRTGGDQGDGWVRFEVSMTKDCIDKDLWEKKLCGSMRLNFWSTTKYSPVKEALPWLWNNTGFAKLRQWIEEGWFDDWVMNYVLLINLLLVFVETTYDLDHWKEPKVFKKLELIFSFVYLTECGLKLCVWSWEEYRSYGANMFDFVTTWLLLGSSLLEEIAGSAGSLKRYMNVLRLLRLVRVIKQLKNIPQVIFMVTTIVRLVTEAKDILTLLLVVMYFFTSLSVQLFGGLLYKSHPALQETEYKESDFWVLNFNDFLLAFGVWVVMLLCEYKAEFTTAIHRTSKIPFSWIIFFIFYVFAVSIIFELVKAFTIEVFVTLHRENHEKQHEKKERKKERRKNREREKGKQGEQQKESEKEGGGCCAPIKGRCAKKSKKGDSDSESEDEKFVGLRRIIKEHEENGKALHCTRMGDPREDDKIAETLQQEEEEEKEEKEREERMEKEEEETEKGRQNGTSRSD